MDLPYLTVSGCSRCGEDHAHLPIDRLHRAHAPPEAAPVEWSHWATCPTNGQPILISFTPKGG